MHSASQAAKTADQRPFPERRNARCGQTTAVRTCEPNQTGGARQDRGPPGIGGPSHDRPVRAAQQSAHPTSSRSRPRRMTRQSTGLEPPMADMGRAGCRNPGSLMPWPGRLAATAVRQSSASWSSLAPDLSAARRSVSAGANRQLRTWPSAVSRTRSHVPQNGRVTDQMMPTRSGPPLIWKVSAGADPLASGPSGVKVNSADKDVRISPAVTMSALRQPCWASSGICSMNRSW